MCVCRLTCNILMPLYLNGIEERTASPIYMQTNISDLPTTTSLDTIQTMNMQIKNTWKQNSNLPRSRNVTIIVVSFISLFSPSSDLLSPLPADLNGKRWSSQWPADIWRCWREDTCLLLQFSYSPSFSGGGGHVQKVSESKRLSCVSSQNCHCSCHMQPGRERGKLGIRHISCRGNVGKNMKASEQWAAFQSPENNGICFPFTENTETGWDSVSHHCTGLSCCQCHKWCSFSGRWPLQEGSATPNGIQSFAFKCNSLLIYRGGKKSKKEVVRKILLPSDTAGLSKESKRKLSC